MFSWIVGPSGVVDSAGAGPRPAGTTRTIRPLESGSQSYGAPKAAFSTGPVSRRAAPSATSTTQSSRPVGASIAMANDLPSGDHWGPMKRALAGRATAVVLPDAMSLKPRPVLQVVRASIGPLVRGLSR